MELTSLHQPRLSAHACSHPLLQEAGYNGIHFNQLAHSWVRNVRVVNSDMAFYSWGCTFCTIDGLEVAGDRGYYSGHRYAAAG